MAITQARAQLEGQWVTLIYNEATRRYEGTLVPSGSSRHEPGGYFPVTVELTNSSGKVETVSGTALKSLRLAALEAEAPTLTLVSPAAGYVTTAAPLITLTARDEAGGSGVDPGSVSVVLDGVSLAPAVTESGGVYTITAQAPALTEGPHSLTAEVSDNDGNRAAVSADYIVDTVPPELWLTSPDSHAVVDDESVVIAGRVSDLTAPPVYVTVGGVGVETDAEGRFSYEVPLPVGPVTIPVRAADAAGLVTERVVYRIRLVTDRAQADLDELRAWLSRPLADWTAEERRRFLEARERGAYNYTDLNRVGIAAGYLAAWLTEYGYSVDVVNPKITHRKVGYKIGEDGFQVLDAKKRAIREVNVWTDETWAPGDIPNRTQMARYLANIASIRRALPSEAPAVPPDMEGLELTEANDIEAVLVAVDAVRGPLEQSFIYAGEAFAGEF